jgi:NAD(P)-dependent dehydrogenase (short-subunit alcohol dehydrogenase family)
MSGALRGRTALVTGAGSGIGRATALLFASEGASLFVIDIDGEAAEGAAKEINASGWTAAWHHADVSDAVSVRRAFDAAEERLGTVDVLVNNAGIYPTSPVFEMDEREWRRVIDVNLSGPFLCCREAVRRLAAKEVEGSIVNVASTAATVARPGVAHYSASKAGLVQLTRVLALEVASLGIRVNALCPGLVETETVRAVIAEGGLAEHEEKLARIPMSRTADPEEVARAALFLASDNASYVTGTALFADGGYSAGQTLHEAMTTSPGRSTR